MLEVRTWEHPLNMSRIANKSTIKNTKADIILLQEIKLDSMDGKMVRSIFGQGSVSWMAKNVV